MAEVALAEFVALRDELRLRQQASHGAIGIALAAAGVIAGLAVGREGGDRLEILLVLPIVLTGLAAFYLENARVGRNIGAYINDYLWDRMHAGARAPRMSWESYVDKNRRSRTAKLAIVPGALIFVVPSAAALLATADPTGPVLVPWPTDRLADGLPTLWFTDLAALVGLGLYGYFALVRPHPLSGRGTNDAGSTT